MKKLSTSLAMIASPVLAAVLLCACNPQHETEAERLPFKADDEVVLSDSAYACESQVQLAKALEHYSRQEYAAWAEVTGNEPYCFGFASVNGNSRQANFKWTVLQIRGDLVQVAFTKAEQVRQRSAYYGHQYWTLTKWVAVPPLEPSPKQ